MPQTEGQGHDHRPEENHYYSLYDNYANNYQEVNYDYGLYCNDAYYYCHGAT